MSPQHKIWGRKCDSLVQNGTVLMMWDLFTQAFIFILFSYVVLSLSHVWCLYHLSKEVPFGIIIFQYDCSLIFQLSLSSVEKQHSLFPRAFELLHPIFNFCIAVNPQVRAEDVIRERAVQQAQSVVFLRQECERAILMSWSTCKPSS